MRVYKYDVPDTDPLYIALPVGARLLKFDYQDSPYGSGFKLWALVDPPGEGPQDRKFKLVGTGDYLSSHGTEKLKYVGTAEHKPTELVAHLFEVTP